MLRGIAPAGPNGGGPIDVHAIPPGDASTHVGPGTFDRAPSATMRTWGDLDQPPLGPVYVDPRHNLYMYSRFAMGWFGGTYPNQPLPDWNVNASANLERYHAPLTQAQMKDRASNPERGRGTLFPTAIQNPALYLRHGGSAPIGIGPMQIQQFKETTDSLKPDKGNGPGATYPNPVLMAGGFAAET